MRLFHQGQLEGLKVKVPVQMRRKQAEASNPTISAFYEKLLPALKARYFAGGRWRLLETRRASQAIILRQDDRLFVGRQEQRTSRCRQYGIPPE